LGNSFFGSAFVGGPIGSASFLTSSGFLMSCAVDVAKSKPTTNREATASRYMEFSVEKGIKQITRRSHEGDDSPLYLPFNHFSVTKAVRRSSKKLTNPVLLVDRFVETPLKK
jgi:hypothetical protein